MGLQLRIGHSTALMFHIPIVTLNILLECVFRDLSLKDLIKQRDTERTEAQIKIAALENEVHNHQFLKFITI